MLAPPGSFFPRWLCSPSFSRSRLSLVQGFVPGQREALAGSGGKRTDGRTDASPGRHGARGECRWEWCHRRPGEPCPGSLARHPHRRSGARRTRCHSRWRRRGSGRRCPALAPRAPVSGPRSPLCTPARGCSFTPAFLEDGAGRGGVEEKSNLLVIAPAYFAGGEMGH